jgi:hypothetical protein
MRFPVKPASSHEISRGRIVVDMQRFSAAGRRSDLVG